MVVLLSCNCFLLCGSWSFCEKLKNFFGCGSSETKGDTVPISNNSHNNEGSFNNKRNDTGTLSFENNNNKFENPHGNYDKYNNFNDLNTDDNYNKNTLVLKNGDINDFDNQYNNLEGVDFSTLGLLKEQGKCPAHNFSCTFLSATDCAVGKTSILDRVKNESFKEDCESTLGIWFNSFFFKTTNNLIIGLEVWDMASGNENQNLTEYIVSQKKNAIIFVYDITDLYNFSNKLEEYIKMMKEKAHKNCLFFLLGNKLDMASEGRQVTINDAQELAYNNDLIFLGECSAKNNEYVPDENTCYKKESLEIDKYCPDKVTGIFKDILYNIVNKQKPQSE